MMRKTPIAACLLAMLLLWPGLLRAQADPPASPASQETQEKLRAWKQRLSTSLQAERSVLRQIYTIESEHRRQQGEFSKINNTLAEIRSRSADAEKQIDRLRDERNQKKAHLKVTLVRLYKLQRGGMWQILFESPDFKTFLLRFKALSYYLKRDIQVINGFQDRVNRLALTQAHLADDIRTLAELKQQVSPRREAVWLERQKLFALLEQVQRNKSLALRATQELERQDERIADTIRSLPAAPPISPVSPDSLVLDFASLKGYLKLPVSGIFVGHFGPQKSRRFGTVTKSNGIKIAATPNASVRVVADGTIRYVGEFLGYGRVLIVDHGDRFHTLYAHLDRFLVQKGDAVKTGMVIGTVSTDSSLGEPVLHFEIRHKGAAQNPLEWLGLGGAMEEP